jgi:putative IMPACT (imprinted ancient) family translation regulator
MFALSQETLYEEEIKKSRFIVKAVGVSSPEAALAFLERVREARATHNCWAYRIGQEYRFSDDGEPGGSGGLPGGKRRGECLWPPAMAAAVVVM